MTQTGMDESTPWQFQYSVPRPPDGEAVEITAEQMERTLLARLAAAKDKSTQAMWELAQFYKTRGLLGRAMEHFCLLLKRVAGLGRSTMAEPPEPLTTHCPNGLDGGYD